MDSSPNLNDEFKTAPGCLEQAHNLDLVERNPASTILGNFEIYLGERST